MGQDLIERRSDEMRGIFDRKRKPGRGYSDKPRPKNQKKKSASDKKKDIRKQNRRKKGSFEKEYRGRVYGRQVAPQTILIDEGGDSGATESASEFYVVASTVTYKPEALADIAIKNRVGGKELKYRDSTPEKIVKILNEYLETDPDITVMVVDKNDLPPGKDSVLTHRQTVKAMLDDVTKNIGGDVTIYFDYNNKLKQGTAGRLAKKAMKDSEVKLVKATVVDSAKCPPMQTHDFVSGSAGRKFNEHDNQFFKIIEKKAKVKKPDLDDVEL